MTPVYDEVGRRSIYKNVELFIRSKTSVYHDAERWSICQTVQYFILINTDVLHFVTVKYSLQQSHKTVFHYNDNSPVIHRSHVTTISRVLKRICSERSNPHIKTQVFEIQHLAAFEFTKWDSKHIDVIQSLFIYLLNDPASLNTLYAIWTIGDNWCMRRNKNRLRLACRVIAEYRRETGTFSGTQCTNATSQRLANATCIIARITSERNIHKLQPV